MAYQEVRTPKILINVPEWTATKGADIHTAFRTLPVGINNFTVFDQTVDFPTGILDSNCFMAILGHTFATTETQMTIFDAIGSPTEIAQTDLINGTAYQAGGADGFSITTFDATGLNALRFKTSGGNGQLGSLLTGIVYDFPHSPDLKLSLDYDYSAVNRVTTRGGNLLTNYTYLGPPAWGNGLGAWELFDSDEHSQRNPAYAKTGRRIWDLNFSYITQASAWPDNAGQYNADPTDTDTLTLLEDDTLQRLITLVNGNQLPFIFMPDGTQDSNGNYNNLKPDNFAICVFDQDSFSFQQTAPALMSVSLTLKEVW